MVEFWCRCQVSSPAVRFLIRCDVVSRRRLCLDPLQVKTGRLLAGQPLLLGVEWRQGGFTDVIARSRGWDQLGT
jgi:hypothetical protein